MGLFEIRRVHHSAFEFPLWQCILVPAHFGLCCGFLYSEKKARALKILHAPYLKKSPSQVLCGIKSIRWESRGRCRFIKNLKYIHAKLDYFPSACNIKNTSNLFEWIFFKQIWYKFGAFIYPFKVSIQLFQFEFSASTKLE